MAGAKEIRSKIASIKSTQKITSAMEKVAVSKMRKAQMRMAASRPYAERIRQVIGHLANANPEYRHPFMIERPVKRAGYIVVSSDRGLCGGLNTNLFKALVKDMSANREQGVEIDLCVIGSKGATFFRIFGGNVVAAISHLGEEPSINDLIGSVKVMLDAYLDGRIDRLFGGFEQVHQYHDPKTNGRAIGTVGGNPGSGSQAPLGLPVRTRRKRAAGRLDGALRGVAGVPGGGREQRC